MFSCGRFSRTTRDSCSVADHDSQIMVKTHYILHMMAGSRWTLEHETTIMFIIIDILNMTCHSSRIPNRRGPNRPSA